MNVSDFDWDDGNWPKCGKHGVGRAEIEELFETDISVFAAGSSSGPEQRLIAIGRTGAGRAVLVVFTMRPRQGSLFIRPISARFIHARERGHYERQVDRVEEAPEADD